MRTYDAFPKPLEGIVEKSSGEGFIDEGKIIEVPL